MMHPTIYKDLGLIDYQIAWDYQTELQQSLITRKLENRDLPVDQRSTELHYLLLCQHNPVYTLGKSGSMDNLLLSEQELLTEGVQFYKINRGGDITYHGPGQIVGYPILDLDYIFTDIHKYVNCLEEAIILTLQEYQIEAFRIPKYTGVWLPATDSLPERKICAIGVHLSRWVTLHGFAFNVNTDLRYFQSIIPCGIDPLEKSVTSMEAELGTKLNIKEVENILLGYLSQVFDLDLQTNL
ncbi:MAG: lipoyl(octanoyl) transferase LipB [Saprospiraceae bacterium]